MRTCAGCRDRDDAYSFRQAGTVADELICAMSMRTPRKSWTWVVLGLFSLTGCSAGTDETGHAPLEPEAGEVRHPVAARLPHSDVRPVVFGRDNTCGSSEFSFPVRALSARIDEGFRADQAERIDFHVREHSRVQAESMTESRVLILESNNRELWTYNVPAQQSARIAGAGQGPGELHFPTGLAIDGRYAHVAQASRRIASFECDTDGCLPLDDLSTELQLTAIGKHGDQFLVVGALPLGGDPNSGVLPNAIHRLDGTGSHVSSHGEAYRTERYPVADAFLRTAGIAVGRTGWHAVRYGLLPSIYVYTADDVLEAAFQFEDFRQGTVLSRGGFLSAVQEENVSNIMDLRILDDAYMFVAVTNRLGSQVRYDYYLIGRSPLCSLHIGSEEIGRGDSVGRWVLTDHHVLRIEEGYVYLIR
jgi:hypothetical protein